MPSLSWSTQTAILRALFQGVPFPTQSNLWLALHNGNPGGSGTQSTFETSYTNYVRIAVPISPGSWLVSSNDPAQAQNIQQLEFPICGTVGDTVSFWSVGYAQFGPGQILAYGAINASAAYTFTSLVENVISVPLLPAGLVVNNLVMALQFGPGMLLPSGMTEGQPYYVGTAIGPLVTLSSQPNNAAPLVLGPGGGILLPVRPIVIEQYLKPVFAANSLFTFMD